VLFGWLDAEQEDDVVTALDQGLYGGEETPRVPGMPQGDENLHDDGPEGRSARADERNDPVRMSAALAEWFARADMGRELEIKRPARLIARLASWLDSRNSARLRSSFETVGLEVHERKADHHYVNQYYGWRAEKLVSGLDDPQFLPIAREVWEAGRTYLYFNRLYTLWQAIANVAREFPTQRLRFLEAGCYKGGSAQFLALAGKRLATRGVNVVTVDTFMGHSPEDLPTGREGVHTVAKFDDASVDDVREYLSPFPSVEVVQGRIQDVGPVHSDPIHLMHLDTDLYAPTDYGLELAVQQVPVGGMVVVDDYGFTTCPGVRRAVDEFVERSGASFVGQALDSGQFLLVRTRSGQSDTSSRAA
jgi:O-methyltransferase